MGHRFDLCHWPGYTGAYVDSTVTLCHKCTLPHLVFFPMFINHSLVGKWHWAYSSIYLLENSLTRHTNLIKHWYKVKYLTKKLANSKWKKEWRILSDLTTSLNFQTLGRFGVTSPGNLIVKKATKRIALRQFQSFKELVQHWMPMLQFGLSALWCLTLLFQRPSWNFQPVEY